MNAPELAQVEATEAIARLAQMPGFLDSAIAGRPPAQLRWQPAPGLFSLVEHACHLRDLECEGYAVRVGRILAEDRPELAGFDGGAVAAARNYPAQDAQQASSEFANARRALLSQLAGLDATQFSRKAVFAGNEITLAGLLSMMLGHDGEHRSEIEALLAAPGAE